MRVYWIYFSKLFRGKESFIKYLIQTIEDLDLFPVKWKMFSENKILKQFC